MIFLSTVFASFAFVNILNFELFPANNFFLPFAIFQLSSPICTLLQFNHFSIYCPTEIPTCHSIIPQFTADDRIRRKSLPKWMEIEIYWAAYSTPASVRLLYSFPSIHRIIQLPFESFFRLLSVEYYHSKFNRLLYIYSSSNGKSPVTVTLLR